MPMSPQDIGMNYFHISFTLYLPLRHISEPLFYLTYRHESVSSRLLTIEDQEKEIDAYREQLEEHGLL